MEAIDTIPDIRTRVSELKKEGKTIGFVPTMGALHEGHLSLIEKARQHADAVVVSIYVNPRQFAPGEDLERYPRTLQDDLKKCREAGVSAVFAPTDAIMYEGGTYLSVGVERLNTYMDGGSRAGFFEGIVTVVNKFFNIIAPDIAVFGQKDVQQFRILQQMVHEFNHDVQLLMAPIVRADDGLALSSRNAYLTDEQRAIAPGLYRGLRQVAAGIKEHPDRLDELLKAQQVELEAKGMKIDYFDVFSFQEMEPVQKLRKGESHVVAGAVTLGTTRLIDNLIIEQPDEL